MIQIRILLRRIFRVACIDGRWCVTWNDGGRVGFRRWRLRDGWWHDPA